MAVRHRPTQHVQRGSIRGVEARNRDMIGIESAHRRETMDEGETEVGSAEEIGPMTRGDGDRHESAFMVPVNGRLREAQLDDGVGPGVGGVLQGGREE